MKRERSHPYPSNKSKMIWLKTIFLLLYVIYLILVTSLYVNALIRINAIGKVSKIGWSSVFYLMFCSSFLIPFLNVHRLIAEFKIYDHDHTFYFYFFSISYLGFCLCMILYSSHKWRARLQSLGYFKSLI